MSANNAGISAVPRHEHVPACNFHDCRVCTQCGRVHHWVHSDVCIHCWVKEVR